MDLNLPLPWQQQQWNYLQNLHKNKRMPHALLFHGINGLGINLFAHYFIKYLFCEIRPTEKPCENCQACLLINKKTHPDYLPIELAENSNLIKVEQIREAINFLWYSADKDHYRVVVINDAEKMHRAAANALLKTLEEPAATKSLIILISTAPENLLATIRSRCQNIGFLAPDQSTAKQWLANYLPDDSRLLSILSLTNNAPLPILDWYQTDKLNAITELINDLNKIDTNTNVALAQKWQREENLPIIDLLISWTIAILKKAFTNDKKTKIIQKKLFQKLDQLYEIKRINNNNVNLNKQLMLEAIFA